MKKVGVIGLGHMGRLHMMNCMHLDDVEVVAAADSSKRALKRAESFGVKNLYEDYHNMFEKSLDLDAVIISLPNFLHVESVKLALESGLDVFIEKPMANTLEECRELIKLEKKHGRRIMVGYYMRFIGFIKEMRDLMEKGRIGDAEVITLEEITNGPFSHPIIPRPVPEWWFDPEKIGGGVVADLGSHMIDLFRFFVGDAEVKHSLLDHNFDLPIEDSAVVLLNSYESSVKGIINVGWYQKSSFPNFDFRMIVHGDAGFLNSDLMKPNIYLNAITKGTKNFFKRLLGKNIQPLAFSAIYAAYYEELKHFFDCITNDNELIVDSVDGMKTAEIVDTVYGRITKE